MYRKAGNDENGEFDDISPKTTLLVPLSWAHSLAFFVFDKILSTSSFLSNLRHSSNSPLCWYPSLDRAYSPEFWSLAKYRQICQICCIRRISHFVGTLVLSSFAWILVNIVKFGMAGLHVFSLLACIWHFDKILLNLSKSSNPPTWQASMCLAYFAFIWEFGKILPNSSPLWRGKIWSKLPNSPLPAFLDISG